MELQSNLIIDDYYENGFHVIVFKGGFKHFYKNGKLSKLSHNGKYEFLWSEKSKSWEKQ